MHSVKENTVVVYTGPSQINNDNIFMAVTGLASSTNRKTGAMLQTYIMLQDDDPMTAVRIGTDVGICAGCKHRTDRAYYRATNVVHRTCYVNIGQGPRSIYKCFSSTGYRVLKTFAELTALGEGKVIRVGTYGDPVAVPLDIWTALLSKSNGHTGYTHQWKNPHFADYRRFCQASVDNEAEALLAANMGWGYFRVAAATGWNLTSNEQLCPASAAAG
jgi:hypothetical protein